MAREKNIAHARVCVRCERVHVYMLQVYVCGGARALKQCVGVRVLFVCAHERVCLRVSEFSVCARIHIIHNIGGPDAKHESLIMKILRRPFKNSFSESAYIRVVCDDDDPSCVRAYIIFARRANQLYIIHAGPVASTIPFIRACHGRRRFRESIRRFTPDHSARPPRTAACGVHPAWLTSSFVLYSRRAGG